MRHAIVLLTALLILTQCSEKTPRPQESSYASLEEFMRVRGGETFFLARDTVAVVTKVDSVHDQHGWFVDFIMVEFKTPANVPSERHMPINWFLSRRVKKIYKASR